MMKRLYLNLLPLICIAAFTQPVQANSCAQPNVIVRVVNPPCHMADPCRPPQRAVHKPVYQCAPCGCGCKRVVSRTITVTRIVRTLQQVPPQPVYVEGIPVPAAPMYSQQTAPMYSQQTAPYSQSGQQVTGADGLTYLTY